MVHLTPRTISCNEYQKMIEVGILTSEDKVELLNGQIITMSPVGKRHAAYVKRITALFYQLLAPDFVIGVQDPIQLNDISEPEPDITILKPSATFYEDHLPTPNDVLLIVEVAESSLEKDREVKMSMYASAGIPEYWIVNIEDQVLETFHTPLDDIYKVREIIRPNDQVRIRNLNILVPATEIFS